LRGWISARQPECSQALPLRSRITMVRTVGIEPTLPIGKKILSLQRLPFRHVR
jgi:hypothetical protein